MSRFNFTQFGTESEIDAKDVGQPKFRVNKPGDDSEQIYVLLGSLHMPLEDENAIKAVESYVNSGFTRDLLNKALGIYCRRTIDNDVTFEYVPRLSVAC